MGKIYPPRPPVGVDWQRALHRTDVADDTVQRLQSRCVGKFFALVPQRRRHMLGRCCRPGVRSAAVALGTARLPQLRPPATHLRRLCERPPPPPRRGEDQAPSERAPPPPDYAEEETGFLHKSMYPKRDRISFSLANALYEHKMTGGNARVTPEELRAMCYRGTKLPEEDIEALLKTASPPPDADGLLDTSVFVATVARQLQGQPGRQHGSKDAPKKM